MRIVAGVLSSSIALINIIGNQNNIGMTRTPCEHIFTKPCRILQDMREQPCARKRIIAYLEVGNSRRSAGVCARKFDVVETLKR